jgi:hypothetical protein
MREDKTMDQNTSGSEAENDDGNRDLGKKIDELYGEVQILKMSGLKKFIKESRSADSGSESDISKQAQQVIKAIETQLRILGEQCKVPPNPMRYPPVEVIWEAMWEIPELRALLARDSIRKRVADNLTKRAGPKDKLT